MLEKWSKGRHSSEWEERLGLESYSRLKDLFARVTITLPGRRTSLLSSDALLKAVEREFEEELAGLS